MEKIKNIHLRKSQGFKFVIFLIVVLAVVQLWFLYSSYREIDVKIPDNLFTLPKPFPVSEITINSPYMPPESEVAESAQLSASTGNAFNEPPAEPETETAEDLALENNLDFSLSDIQKKIVFRLVELIEEDIEYGYKAYRETGYPNENVWISTDVISVVLRDVGYDIMELVYEDITAHKEDYPMDKTGRKDPAKNIDFRNVFILDKFFKRNALTLETEFILDKEDNDIQWQAGDIVFFEFENDNLGGFISSRLNEQGAPLIIMISKEFGKISEVDKLLEYNIVGHYRFPNPYEEDE